MALRGVIMLKSEHTNALKMVMIIVHNYESEFSLQEYSTDF